MRDSELPSYVSRLERKWLFWFALLAMLLTTLPYLLGYARQGDTWQFTGFLFGVEDGNSYIAKMMSGAYGAWLFKTPYTTVFQTGVLAFIPYLLLGKLASGAGIHEQLVAIYHLFRLVAGILAIFATYDFLSILITSISLRRLGLVLSILGGGLGWLSVILGSSDLPLEFYSPETFGFLSLFGIPHLALARATFLWFLVIYLRYISAGTGMWQRKSIQLGLLWLATALAQPITALVLGILLGLHISATGLWQALRNRRPLNEGWMKWRNNLLMVVVSFLIPAPFLLYNYISFSSDPFLRSWTAQNIITSPDPIQYLLAYGLVLPFSIAGLIHLLRVDTWKGLFFAAWMLALPLLAYAPFNLQRRLLEGVWVGLVALAVAAIEAWHQKELPDRTAWFRKGYTSRWIFLLAFPSTIMLFLGGLLAAWNPSMPVFRLKDEILVFNYLQQSASPGEIVLASFNTSNAVPAWAPLRLVIGHGPESVGLADLRPQVEDFYRSDWSAAEREQFIDDHNVHYIIRGPLERQLGEWDPTVVPYLDPVFELGEFKLFKVVMSFPE